MKVKNKVMLVLGGAGVAALGYLGYKKYKESKVSGEIVDTDLTISKSFSEMDDEEVEEFYTLSKEEIEELTKEKELIEETEEDNHSID